MTQGAHDLARRLADRAETVCRHYLSNGRRQGRYWQVGDVRNTPGRSMFLRLEDTARGPAGKWTDAATGEHGDLLDVIRAAIGPVDFADVVEEARHFLSLPPVEPEQKLSPQDRASAPCGSAEAARRLMAISQPIAGTLAETYLRGRAITALCGTPSLRFHPRCYYRPRDEGPPETWPAMIAAVTDLSDKITGAHRTWLAPDGSGKAPIDVQRKAMGHLLGHAVRFGHAGDVLAAGEGIENVLSVREIMPGMAACAALSAAHLAAILFPDALRRLYIIRDKDPAGDGARDILVERARAAGIEAIVLSPMLRDFNEDLRLRGRETLRARVLGQVASEEIMRFVADAA